MGFTQKQLKTILEKYGYRYVNFFYTKKYYTHVECVLVEYNIPVIIKLSEKLKFYAEETEDSYKIKRIDTKDLYTIYYQHEYKTTDEIDTGNLDDFEQELLKTYKKNNKFREDMKEKNNTLMMIYNQNQRLSELVKKAKFQLSLIDGTYLLENDRVYEIKNFKESDRKMYICFNLDMIYDNNSGLKKNVMNIYSTICDTLYENFKSQITATEDIVKNYNIDYKMLKKLLENRTIFDKKITDLTKTYNDKRTQSEKMQKNIEDLDKNVKTMSELQYFRMKEKSMTDLAKYVGDMEKISNEIVILRNREKNMFLRFEEIFFENIKCLQTIRKNLSELQKIFLLDNNK